MPERFNPESPRGKIARTVETVASKEFGPEKLTRADVARCLNLGESDISDEEWADISEFAVNIGSDLIRSAIQNDLPETFHPRDVKRLNERVEMNQDKLVPFHDLFHAAETYRLTQGKKAGSDFIEAGPRGRYADPAVLSAELYPLLFLADPWMEAPMSVLLQSPEGRREIADFFKNDTGLPEASRKDIEQILLGETPGSPEGKQKLYESLVETVVLGNAHRNVLGITPEEIETIQTNFRATLDNPPGHYAKFAHQVFSGAWRDNPRLFLDELLGCIRTQPKP